MRELVEQLTVNQSQSDSNFLWSVFVFSRWWSSDYEPVESAANVLYLSVGHVLLVARDETIENWETCIE